MSFKFGLISRPAVKQYTDSGVCGRNYASSVVNVQSVNRQWNISSRIAVEKIYLSNCAKVVITAEMCVDAWLDRKCWQRQMKGN